MCGQPNRRVCLTRELFVLACLLACFIYPGRIAVAQEHEEKRGFNVGGSYALSDIETINTVSGNMMLRLPVGKLPLGRGGMSGGIDLLYNSKLYDTHVEYVPNLSNQITAQNFLGDSQDGGWRYGIGFSLELKNRLDDYETFPSCPDAHAIYIWKLKVHFPDGSSREFRPLGFADHFSDGFFTIRPDGWQTGCSGTSPSVTGDLTYYSTDGSYMRLTIPHTTSWEANWTLSMPDGSRVVTTPGLQRIYDRNNNYISLTFVTNYNNTGQPATLLEDSVGRAIALQYDATTQEDLIHTTGFGNETLTYRVRWKAIFVNKNYKTTAWGVSNERGGTSTQELQLSFTVVDRITLPAQSGSLAYIFGYNAGETGPSFGWGEVSSITLPSQAQAQYTFEWDGSGPINGSLPDVDDILDNSPTGKTLNYDQQYDGSVTPTSETWTYNIGKTGSFMMAPDGGVTSESFGDTSFPNASNGLIFKTSKPDGTVIERIWKQNMPFGLNPAVQTNPFVKTEFISIKNEAGVLSLTRIMDYNYDKNGNVTQLKEYDWVNYGSVARDQFGRPTGAIPASAVVKRMTTHAYWRPTPDALNTTTATGDCYWNPSAPRLRNAVFSTEISNGAQTRSRMEFYYDNPAITGNVTQQVIWDSVKGGLSNPLTPANSISTSTQYDGFGNPILTTDARGTQTELVYGLVGTVTDLYPTQIKSAFQTSVQRTETRQYDFHTGVITRVTDVDNNVSTSTTFDAFGRPTLVRAAEDRPEENRTATEYSDVNRRVIVRSDLNTPGDSKLVKIQHYDQLGRVRLSRQLEDATGQSATDETTGIKVQTRYKYSGSFSFGLTSNPYRAATSTAATNEATMGWSRTKRDQIGRVVEEQTFAGADLPAPWGGNANTTGTTTTSYDANSTTISDQAQRTTKSVFDGLERLKEVYEDPNGFNYLTSYGYDALGNLISVTQGQQTRSFVYSSRSLLTSATNPETCDQQGQQCIPVTVTYEYDENGSLKNKTDGRLITTHFEYDGLNRVISKTYLNDPNNTPSAHYYYDSQSLPSTQGVPTFDRGFSAGRVVAVLYGGPQSITGNYQGYDAMGRIKRSIQVTNDGQANQTYTFPNYDFDLAGNLKSQTYPSGRIVASEYDPAGRLAGVKKAATSFFYAGGASTDNSNRLQYSASGAISQMRLGNQLWEHTNFNSRLQPIQIGLGTSSTNSSVLQLDYDYGTTTNNGNVAGHTITIPGLTLSQSYTYDMLNRLETANENGGTSWKQKFLYDRYGNRRIDPSAANTSSDLVGPNPVFSEASNRIVPQTGEQYQYDKAGNLTRGREGQTYNFDGDHRMTSFNGGASQGGASYIYDGDGRRVKKVVGNTTTVFVYDAMGRLAAEYSSAPPTTNGTLYLTTDYLRSPRAITDANGVVKARHDYHPFGEEVGLRGGRSEQNFYVPDTVRQKFALYERDLETDLDFAQARYYAKWQGRFISVDPLQDSAKIAIPQSWNRYSYALNNPMVFIDPTGELWVASGDAGNPYRWVDECPEGATCFDSVAAVVTGDDNVTYAVVYGSSNASDITAYTPNQHGMIDLAVLETHADAEFVTRDGRRGVERFANLETAVALFNATLDYSEDYPDDDRVMVTNASLFDGTAQPVHRVSHGRPNSAIDFRYLNNRGRSLQGMGAAANADPERMRQLFDRFDENGFNQSVSGRPRDFGTGPRPGNPRYARLVAAHQNHGHVGIVARLRPRR